MSRWLPSGSRQLTSTAEPRFVYTPSQILGGWPPARMDARSCGRRRAAYNAGMSSRTLPMSDALQAYLLGHLRAPEILRELRAETARLPGAGMQISPEQGALMAWLVETSGVRRALEVGTYTGYSALCVALALPPDGRLIACDLNEEWTAIARRYWERAGVAGRIELRLGPAVQTLDALLAAGGGGTFDFAFLDADKENLRRYYEQSLRLLRPGGLVAIDNAFWDGRVADPAVNDNDTVAIRDLTRHIRDDPRASFCIVPVGDGLILARKRQ